MMALPPQLLKDIHEQTVRDAQQAARKRRVGRASDLTWELKRDAGVFRKRLKILWNVGMSARNGGDITRRLKNVYTDTKKERQHETW
jgi:hypothetical protein